jgi:hypothetical protein
MRADVQIAGFIQNREETLVIQTVSERSQVVAPPLSLFKLERTFKARISDCFVLLEC